MLHQQTIHDMLNAPATKTIPSYVPTYLEQYYDKFLCEMHFPPSLKGYPYIKQALYHEHKNRRNLPALHKDIYREIAELYNTQICAVERCISFCIQKAYERNPNGFRRFFPDCKKAPSNFCFLKTVSLYLDYSEEA